jgi:endonuclease/exonuclease/phosphatase family metal-dependent hydrolase
MNKLIFFFIFAIDFTFITAQTKTEDTIFTAFWNLENLFDTTDDPGKDDEEFTPGGEKEWNDEKLEKKLYKLARGIRSMNMGRGPDILGVCEVEHQSLLERLIRNFFKDKNFKSAYAESPDERGIDNGLIYNSDKFSLLSVLSDTIKLEGDSTRLILNVNLKSTTGDTLIIFVNHWPSRRTGEEESEGKRIRAAEVLKKKINFYSNKNSNAKIILLGDFNDEPDNYSVSRVLGAAPIDCGSTYNISKSDLYNISYTKFKKGEGSFKFRDDWNMLDQIIVSGSLLTESGGNFLCSSFQVYKPHFLQTYSGKYKGTPFPAYGGSRYLGGYSDHYPVTAKIILERERND